MSLLGVIRSSWLNWLLIFIPVSIAVEVLELPKIWLFVTSALAIIPLAGLVGEGTEQIATRVGPGVGGLLNATFGNATELIIALIALRAGLQEVVKASISGSIIGNILLVLGASMLAGGWGRLKQSFNQTNAGATSAMLVLAVVALVMPAVFDLEAFGSLEFQGPDIQTMSLLVSVVLILTYFASLIFSLKTHRLLLNSAPAEPHHARLSVTNSIILLILATVLSGFEAEFLVSGIEEATAAVGMTEFFVGVIVVAIVGNAAEHFSAIIMAKKDKMDLAVTICTASSTQIALFVAPVLVFASFLFGNPMSLVFNAYEIMGIALSVGILAVVSLDGESNWFEGLQLLAVYVVLAIVFFFVRETENPNTQQHTQLHQPVAVHRSMAE